MLQSLNRDAGCVAIRSLRELHRFDLHRCDIVLCSVELPDGSGLDAIAHIEGVRPDLGVLLIGELGGTDVATEAIRAGALDCFVADGSDFQALPLALEKSLAQQRVKQENEQLQLDLGCSLKELAFKNNQLRSANSKLAAMARTDDLTGLYNRRYLHERLEQAWARAERSRRPLAFMMIDLDRFKAVNDTFGHQQGDKELRRAAMVIDANCRQVDVTARYGGDEFCVLMPNTEIEQAVLVSQRILQQYKYSGRIKCEGVAPPGMSIGIAHVDLSRPANAQQLIQHADEAMYAAKSDATTGVMIREADGVFVSISDAQSEAPRHEV